MEDGRNFAFLSAYSQEMCVSVCLLERSMNRFLESAHAVVVWLALAVVFFWLGRICLWLDVIGDVKRPEGKQSCDLCKHI